MPKIIKFDHGIAAESLPEVIKKTLERLPNHVFKKLVNDGGMDIGLHAHFSTGYDGKTFGKKKPTFCK